MKIKLTERQFNRIIINEAIDFSTPIINLIPNKNNDSVYSIRGFISFDATKSDVAINNAIQKIKDDLSKKDLEISNVVSLNVIGGASNYLDGPMSAERINTNADDPLMSEPATKSNQELSGQKNYDKNKEYATKRANAVKDAIIKAFPSKTVNATTNSFIMDTGGKIDKERDITKYPIPGQQAKFSLTINVKKKEKEIPPFNASEVFKETKSNRTSADSAYYGSETVKIGGKDVNMCKILSKNDTLGLQVNLPEIGLEKFQAKIFFDGKQNKYIISNKSGVSFTKPQWVWIYWYLTNEQNRYKCNAFDYTLLPSWLKSVDLSKVTFGAMDKEHEFVHDKSKHDIVKENKNMKKVRLTEKQLMNIVRKTINEESKGENYMFFSNLKQMRRQLDIMLNEFDPNMVNDTLNNGHDWADDHITEAKVNIDQVFDFFMNKLDGEDVASDMLEEKWSQKYKKSIDCNNPKGFSQRAHCQGRNKRK